MSVLLSSRVPFSNGIVGVDDISLVLLRAMSWRALQTTKAAFPRRYLGLEKRDIESWLWNVIVLVP